MKDQQNTVQQDLLILDSTDNIGVLKRAVVAGSKQICPDGVVQIRSDLSMGHKVAVSFIAKGEDVLKYGAPIGFAACDIAPGTHVHLHNLTSRYTRITDMEMPR